MKKYIFWVSFAALSALTVLPAHAADKCGLPLIAALKLKLLPTGDYSIPVTVGGTEREFLLDMSAPFSAISGKLADQLGYRSIDLPEHLRPRVNGEDVTRKAIVSDLGVGTSHGKDFEMLRTEKPLPGGSDIAGIAALDLLQNFDIELDVSALKLNLFSHNDCDEKVYWAPSYADAGFKKDLSGHIAFDMRLDDKSVTVDFDVSDAPSTIGSKTLARIFNLTPESAGMTAETKGTETVWHYPFKTLSLDGVVINNPRITIHKDDGPECRPERQESAGREMRCYGSANLRLRAATLKSLHLYIAFKDKRIYITAADAHL